MSLGSIYQSEDESQPRGRDLTTVVEVPRWALGAGPHPVDVPLELPTADGTARRAVGPGERGSTVHLNLPASVPDGATLRMRGLGEAIEGGRAGDLYVQIALTDAPRPAPEPAAALGPAGGGLFAAVLGMIILGALGVIGWLALR